MVMEAHESAERVAEGLSRAASCCRELGVMTSIKSWNDLSKQLLIMRKKAKFMYDSAPLSEFQVQSLVTDMEIAQLAAGQLRSMNG